MKLIAALLVLSGIATSFTVNEECPHDVEVKCIDDINNVILKKNKTKMIFFHTSYQSYCYFLNNKPHKSGTRYVHFLDVQP